MIESKNKWMIERPDETVVEKLSSALAIPSVHAKILASRGITDPEEAKLFLHMDESSMHDPYLMNDMKKAVTIIKNAIENKEKIAIYGDYDADGVTSIAVLSTALEQLGADVFFIIPDRFEHGYGPHKDLFQEIYNKGASVIVTVDNGVSGIDEVAFAKTLGMKVIITDHHEAGETWPDADAIIHPRHPDGDYPFKDLAGVGVAFKLASALLDEIPFDLLEFVAIGTVADLVPLRGENRYFVKEGIKRLRSSRRPSIQALTKIAGTEQSKLTEETIGFMIGPRLNAVGRLGDASPAVDLLKTTDAGIATGLAEKLDTLNKERQELVSTITKEAEAIIMEMYGDEIPKVFVIAKENWNSGVVGIVASRLTEKYYRPSIVLSIDSEAGIAKGSARSIDGFNMYEELTENAHILAGYGGHPMAAGMTVDVENLHLLRENLNRQAESVLTEEQLIPKLSIDVPLTLEEIDVTTLEKLELLRPFGMGFEKPTYLFEDLIAGSVRKIGAAKNHMKLDLTDGGLSLDTIGFGFGDIADQITPNVKLSVVGDLQVNEWNGNKKPQLLVRDILSDEWQLFDLRGIREASRWLHSIPVVNTAYIAFHEHTIEQFRPVLNGNSIHLYGEDAVSKAANIVLLDIPTHVSLLEEIVKEYIPERIYAHFHVPESRYFDGLPSREQFGWYYSFIKSRGSFDFVQNGEKLAKHKGWRNDSIKFMSKVFSELGFVTIKDGVISIADTVEKRDLKEAPAYIERKSQMKLEERLLYAPYMELKSWFDTIRNGTKVGEEIYS
ncbi:single-stranded-DNA-specific exonuclease RecJ [Sporosarcina jiandibaonis]|uniref:single-stranded-DNA-specific exonuclease RecJ n=1 Tax=Sporosarcina jiandibaonis TaxID=2715535 RepID=UPI001551DB76|nr:single-stranded-DNA-specific exonuclease RecJ [Sporosarcina jiandibaonis]